MIGQTWAILVDSYRELNSKRLFWITLGLSVLLVGLFACFGVNERGMTILGWTIPIPIINSRIFPPGTFYKLGFIKFGIQFWLAWGATILALVSTAPIFPDFLASGAIELVLSKPISRLRLFLTKYVVGLLFVAMQVAVFTTASYLVIGIRGGVWDAKVFWAVPVVLCFFSYLWSVCALMGVLTRSTIASLLLTLLFWFVVFLVNAGDKVTLGFREETAITVIREEKRIARMEKHAANSLDRKAAGEGVENPPRGTYTPEQLDAENAALAKARIDLASTRDTNEKLVYWNDLLVNIKTALPKTDDTIWVLKRLLITKAEQQKYRVEMEKSLEERAAEREARRREARKAQNQPEPNPDERRDRVTDEERAMATEDAMDARSFGWVIGTSLGFEAVVLGLAAWRFRRRDF